MRFIIMFVAAVCFMFFRKWSKNTNIYEGQITSKYHGSNGFPLFLKMQRKLWQQKNVREDFVNKFHAGGRFSKIPKLFGRISGDIKRFVSSKGNCFKSRNFAIVQFVFAGVENMFKDQFFKMNGS